MQGITTTFTPAGEFQLGHRLNPSHQNPRVASSAWPPSLDSFRCVLTWLTSPNYIDYNGENQACHWPDHLHCSTVKSWTVQSAYWVGHTKKKSQALLPDWKLYLPACESALRFLGPDGEPSHSSWVWPDIQPTTVCSMAHWRM